MKIRYLILLLIVLLAGFSRFYKITTLPPSLYSDEVDIGYQAQTFNQNHTDYFGNRFPVDFHSFADWQPSLGIYLTSFLQKITGNYELSVRLPSAMFGVSSVIMLYLITGSLLPSFLLSISPWAIHYSRTGFAVSGMIFFILTGIYFWQRYIKDKKLTSLLFSTLFFCLSPYFYSTAKLFLPIIFIVIFIVWFDEIKRINLSKIILAGIFCSLLLTPMLIDTIQGKAGFRFSYIGIFTEPHREQVTDNLRYQDARTDHPDEIGISTSLTSKMFHNKYELIGERFIKNYISAFSTNFLFISGDDNQRHGFGGHGLLYLLDGILIVIGIFYKRSKLSNFFLLLLFLSPIPSSLTRDSLGPHATRLILMLPSLIYFSAQGILSITKKFPRLLVITITVYILSFITFTHYYYYHYSQDSAIVWHTGMKEAVLAAKETDGRFVFFSDSYEPFLPFFLFYNQYQLPTNNSIENHLTTVSNSSFSGKSLDNTYFFGRFNWSNQKSLPSPSIIVLPKSEYDSQKLNLTISKKIGKKYINQTEFYILQIQ